MPRFPLRRLPIRAEYTPIYPGGGGGNIEKLLGREPSEAPPTEDWLASTTRTNRNPNDPNQGISIAVLPDGERIYLDELIARDLEGMLGPGHEMPHLEVLAKFLDKRTRFSVQVHPTKEFARRHLGSAYGKAESWIILETRLVDGAESFILLGWKEPMSLERWSDIVRSGDPEAQVNALNRIPVKPGEVYYVEGGWVHAAGSGIFMVEVQEPSDIGLSTEHICAGGGPPPQILRGGLPFEVGMRMLTYDMPTGGEFVRLARQTPTLLRESDQGSEWSQFDPWARTHFDATRVEVTGTFVPEVRPYGHLFVVVKGSGNVATDAGSMEVGPGDRVFMPADASEYELSAGEDGALSVIRCFPPAP